MKLTLLMSASIVSLSVLAGPALAQDASSASSAANKPAEVTVDEIVVVGIRKSLQTAIATKRAETVISDVISAEDIGKFPDQNLAESLQRITGVQITRSQGEGQNVTVRGLDPRFARVTYNGRNLPSATGSRSFDFTILSSDFISALKVLKTPSADMQEGGLAATIDVETPKPLSLSGRKISVTAEGIHDYNDGSTTPHFAAVYSDKFFDDTLGVSLGVDYSKRKLKVDQYQAFGFEPSNEASKNFDVNGNGTRTDSFAFNHAASFASNVGERTRTSFMGGLQYKPNSAFEGRADVLYSKFKNDTIFPINANRFTNITGGYVAAKADKNNFLTLLDANGVDNRNNARTNTYEDELKSVGVGGTFYLDKWTIDGEVSAGSSIRRSTDLSLEVIGRSNAVQDLSQDPSNVASVTYVRGYDRLNPNNFRAIGFNGSINVPTKDISRDAHLVAEYAADFGWIEKISFGVNYGDRTHSTSSSRLSVSAEQIATALKLPYDPVTEGGSFNASSFMKQYGGSDFLGSYKGAAKFDKTWLSADPYLLLKQLPLSKLISMSPLTQNLTAVSRIDEESTAAFGKVDFVQPDGPITGNFGVRVIRTKQKSVGYAPDYSNIIYDQGGAVTIVPNVTLTSINRTYTKVLPSLNVKYELTPSLSLRMAAARTMTRPDLSVLSPATTINANIKNISSGNPTVDPYLANQADVSLEWYVNRDMLVSAAVFYKDIDSFIVATQRKQTLTVKNLQGGGTSNIEFTVSQPGNGEGSKIKGLELAVQAPLTFLPAPFDGFGIIANYTYIDADPASVVLGGPALPLPGVSKNNFNLVGYYEKGPIGLRLSYNYRDKYVVDALSYFGDGDVVKSYGQLDLSANYNVNDHVTISVDGLNLTNEPVVNVSNYGYSRGYEDDGRRLTVGVHAKF